MDSESNSPNGTVEFTNAMTYDDVGRLLTGLQDEFDVTTTFTYDDGGRVASEATGVYGQTYTVSRNYDDAGRLETLTYPDGSIVAHAYTDRGQLEEVTHDLDGAGGNGPVAVADFTYDDGGRETARTHGNGVQTTRGYVTGENLVEDITVVGHTALSFDYTYDANKNVTSETRGGALSGYGFTTPSGYDDEDRLVAWQRDDSNLDLSWVLSDVGDWDSYTENTTTQTRTHNAVHELTAIDAGSLTYDSRGNLTQDHEGRQFAFANSNNMLASTTRSTATGGFDATYKYDALGRRVAKQVDDDSGQTTVVRYTIFVPTLATLPPLGNQGGQVTAEYEKVDAGSWTLARTFTYGAYVDEPLTMTDYTAAGSTGAGTAETFTYHAGRTYNISGLTNTSGNLAEAYAYQPYGEVDVFDASLSAISATALGNPYLFTARRYDDESQTHYFRARLLQPLFGYFTARDPMGYSDGNSLYLAYFAGATNDPSGYGMFHSSSTGGSAGWLGWKLWWEYIPIVSTVGHANKRSYLEGSHVFDYTPCKADFSCCKGVEYDTCRDIERQKCSDCIRKQEIGYKSGWVGLGTATDLAEVGGGLVIIGNVAVKKGGRLGAGAATGGVLTIDGIVDAGIQVDGIGSIGSAAADAIDMLCNP